MREDSAIVNAVPEKARDAVGEANVYSILEVAYLLASIDGVIRDEEIGEFRATAKMLLGDRFVSEEAIAFFARMQSLSNTVVGLLKFYASDDAALKVFEIYSRTAVESISRAAVGVVRRAFAFWGGMCCSDNEYAPIERKAIDALRNSVGSMNRAVSSALSDKFFEELERRVLEVNEFEKKVLDASGVGVKEKESELLKQMQSFGRFLDTFPES